MPSFLYERVKRQIGHYSIATVYELHKIKKPDSDGYRADLGVFRLLNKPNLTTVIMTLGFYNNLEEYVRPFPA